ncbi:NPCBM/NEW2 domain-containing protein [Patescibacteria group bacterium]|nr:NPCBM/NEW2 domain-containing protein [Patescibacteria group bacterium]
MKRAWTVFGSVVFLAVLLRLILLPNPGFEADISFWKSWGLAVYDHGLLWTMHHTNDNYPAPFAYLLGFLVWIYGRFADPHTFAGFWNDRNLLFLTISKLPAVFADFGIAGIIVWIGKHAKRFGFPVLPAGFYFLLAAFSVLNPVSLIDGAWWGQIDSLGVFVFLLAVIAALRHKPMLAGVLYMTSMMTKLQNMIYGPVFFLFLWEYLGYTGLVRGVIGSALAFFGLNIEFFLNRDMGTVVGSLTNNFDYFPLLSLNAFNLWWIVAGARGMQISDKILAIGMINAKTVGLILFSGFYLFAVLRQLVNRHGADTIRYFIESLIIVNAAFFLFQTESHDRYAFPLTVFLLLWGLFLIPKVSTVPNGIVKNTACKLFLILYGIFSLIYFYNLHTALVFNYPGNGLPILKHLTQPFLTIPSSLFLISLFGIFVFVMIKKTSKISIILPVSFIVLAILYKNVPLLARTPVSLTQLTPVAHREDYGTLEQNMPVGAFAGFPKWGFLSDQYAFYRYGFGTHANSFINFDLNGNFRRLTTDFGIDTEAGSQGLAVFEIYGDGRKLFSSGKMGRYDLPGHASIDIKGVKTLGLVTVAAGNGITDDHTDWLNPIVYPK